MRSFVRIKESVCRKRISVLGYVFFVKVADDSERGRIRACLYIGTFSIFLINVLVLSVIQVKLSGNLVYDYEDRSIFVPYRT